MLNSKVKKIILGGCMLVMAASLVGGCGSSNQPTSNKLVVGTNATFVPFEFKDEKTQDYTGFDIELIRAIGKRINKDVELKNVAFDALIPALNTHDIDVAASGMTITKARSEKVLFSSPYYENALAVVYKDGTAVNSLDDLKGKKIAAQLGTTGADLAHKIEGTTVKEFDHSNEALLELQNGGVDATVIDLPVAQYYSTKHPDQHIKFMAYPNTKEYLGLAINKDNKALQEEINKAIADMKADGEFNTLYKKWFNVGCGFFIGLLVSLANLSKFRLVRLLAKCYVDIIRGTPLLVQIFLIYFALPMITGQRIDPYIAAVTACSINSGAYVSEIFRAGIQSIDKGQMEAGRSLGLTWGQTMRYIIMPQAFKAIIPPLGNEFIAMLKDSSLVSVIGFEELTRRGQLIIAKTYASFEIWGTVAVIYLIMTVTISQLVGYLERKYSIK